MGKKVKIDAWQKFQNPLLTQYNVEQLAELKRSNWSGLLMGVDQLYSTMYHEWDSLQKDVNDMSGAVRALEWTVMPNVRDGEEPTPEAQEVARVVSEAIWRRGRVPLGGFAHGFPEMIASMVHAIFRGWNVHQIEWANDGELVYPERYIQLPPQFLIWETRTGKPDRLLLVPDGQSGEGVPFADDMFLVALNNNGPDHPVYNAVFYSLVNWFLAYKFGLGWFMQFTQKFGMPKQVFHYSSAKDKEALIAEMEDERAINSLFIRGDRKYELVNAPQAGASLPQAVLLERAEAACHKAILGQTLTSDTSSHGGSLAQAKVHAGVRAELVRQYAEFVAEVLNRQLVPAIVRANFGRVEGIELPEIRCKLPKTQANIEMAQAWQAVLQIPGMKVKKSEVYDSLGVSAPEEGEEVFEAQAAHGTPMGGMEDMQPAEVPQAQEGGEEAVQTAKRKVDPAQEWLEPLKQKLREARENGASLAELRESVRKWKPNTAALAGAFANNIERGLMGSETAKAANPFGCNQYGEGWAIEHNGLRSEPGKPMKKGDKPKEEEESEENRKETDSLVDKLGLIARHNVEYNGKGGWDVAMLKNNGTHNYITVPYKQLQKEADGYRIVGATDAEYKEYSSDKGGYYKFLGNVTPEDLKRRVFEQNNRAATYKDEEIMKEALEFHAKDEEEAEKLIKQFREEHDEAFYRTQVEGKKGQTEGELLHRKEEASYRAARKVFNKWRKKYPYDPIADGGKFAELAGSPKQVSWAEKIREGAINEAYRGIPVSDTERMKKAEETILQMRRIKSASWWIDNRGKKSFTLEELKKAAEEVKAARVELQEDSEEFAKAYEEWKAAHCNQYEHAPDCENTGKANGVKKKLGEVKQALEKLGQGNESLRKGLELTAKLLDGYMRDFEQAASEAERTAILAEAQDMVDYAQDLLGDAEKLGNEEQEPKAKRYFPEAKDLAEATKNTQALAEGAAVNWGEGFPVHIVNQYNEAMGEMMEKYPLRAKFVRLGAYVGNSDATLARCRAGAMGGDDVLLLELNKNHDINGIHALSEGRLFSEEEQARTGYARHNVGATEDGMTVRAVTIHEYGHGIKAWCNLRSMHSDMFDIDEVREARRALDEWSQAVKSARASGFKVSQYGDADDEEFFAECFAARELGEKLPEGVERAMNKLVVLALKK